MAWRRIGLARAAAGEEGRERKTSKPFGLGFNPPPNLPQEPCKDTRLSPNPLTPGRLEIRAREAW